MYTNKAKFQYGPMTPHQIGLGFVNIPTIINGMKYSNKDAIMHYKLTGQHLGKFAPSGIKEPWSEADKAANDIHLRQEKMYTGQPSAQ